MHTAGMKAILKIFVAEKEHIKLLVAVVVGVDRENEVVLEVEVKLRAGLEVSHAAEKGTVEVEPEVGAGAEDVVGLRPEVVPENVTNRSIITILVVLKIHIMTDEISITIGVLVTEIMIIETTTITLTNLRMIGGETTVMIIAIQTEIMLIMAEKKSSPIQHGLHVGIFTEDAVMDPV